MRHVVATGGAGGRRPPPSWDARSPSSWRTEVRTPPAPQSRSAHPPLHQHRRLIGCLSSLRLQIDTQLLAFLIEMTALEPERARRLSHAVAVSRQLAKHSLTLEGGDAVGQRATARRARRPLARYRGQDV